MYVLWIGFLCTIREAGSITKIQQYMEKVENLCMVIWSNWIFETSSFVPSQFIFGIGKKKGVLLYGRNAHKNI